MYLTAFTAFMHFNSAYPSLYPVDLYFGFNLLELGFPCHHFRLPIFRKGRGKAVGIRHFMPGFESSGCAGQLPIRFDKFNAHPPQFHETLIGFGY